MSISLSERRRRRVRRRAATTPGARGGGERSSPAVAEDDSPLARGYGASRVLETEAASASEGGRTPVGRDQNHANRASVRY